MGAYLNVKINTKDLADESAVADYLRRGQEIQDQALAREVEILALVEARL